MVKNRIVLGTKYEVEIPAAAGRRDRVEIDRALRSGQARSVI
jgi:hypothetical protein